MNSLEMLHHMCHEGLSETDIKAIGKARGFSKRDISSRSSFESCFLSNTGVADSLQTLSETEIFLLHLLKFQKEEVDVRFFMPFFGQNKQMWDYGRTYTDQCKVVLSRVRDALLRKGLLLMAEDNTCWRDKSKMSRLRFLLPDEFVCFLPSPFASVKHFDNPGETNDEKWKEKLAELLSCSERSEPLDKNSYALNLVQEKLYMGSKKFKATRVREWQQHSWNQSVGDGKKKAGAQTKLSEAVSYAFSCLREKEWITPEELGPLVGFFLNDTTPHDYTSVCEAGWQYGCLAMLTNGSAKYYRPSEDSQISASSASSVKEWLVPHQSENVRVVISDVSSEDLELLSEIAHFTVSSREVVAAPDFMQMSKAPLSLTQNPIFLWLMENSAAFQKAQEKIHIRKGKCLVHKDLLIAQIRDLSLKIKIEKAFPDRRKVLPLSQEFIAFPRAVLPEIQKLVSKAGHVIKMKEQKP